MEKRKLKSRKDEEDNMNPTKEEYAISKFLRFTVPSKKANMFGSKVQYFVASKAVDALMTSKWGIGKKAPLLFSTRESCVAYLNILLQKNIFHRVRKFVKVLENPDKPKKITKTTADKPKTTSKTTAPAVEADDTKGDKNELRRRKKAPASKDSDKEADLAPEEPEKSSKKSSGKKDNDSNKSATDDKGPDKSQGDRQKKKDKKKVKLELHDTQVFIDGSEQFYVWVYDPVPLKTWILGFFIVIGAIVICLFPLWPPLMRTGVYYISLAGAGFLGFILSLALVRYIVYGIVWFLTLGKHRLWLLPNLLEDVGFVESFIPIYTYKYHGSSKEQPSSKKKKSPALKTADDGEPPEATEKEVTVVTSTTRDDDDGVSDEIEDNDEGDVVQTGNTEDKTSAPSSSKSSTSKNGAEDFEIIGDEKSIK